MKNIHIKTLIILFSITIMVSCTLEVVEEERSASELTQDNPADAATIKNSVSEETIDAIPVDLGEIGVAIDVRQLAIYGYKPTKVNFVLEGELNIYSQENIPVDEYTHIANFKLLKRDLTDEILSTFSEGIPISVTIFDSANNNIEIKTDTKFVINGTRASFVVETTKPRIFNPLKINPEIPHYLIISGASQSYFLGGSVFSLTNNLPPFWAETSTEPKRMYLNDDVFSSDSEIERRQIQKFEIVNISEDIYTIKTEFENSYLEYSNGELRWNKNNNTDNINFIIEDKHKFVFAQTENGLIKIRPLNSDVYLKVKRIRQYGIDQFYLSAEASPATTNISETEILEFDVLAANIVWEFNNLGTSYSAAILPPAEMDFAFGQTIINCSGASGEYFVGVDREETKTTSITLEESINLYSSVTDSKSATVEASASGSLFGVGVSVSASGTLASSATTGYGDDKTFGEGTSFSETETVSSNRKITVPPYTSVEVLDVIQSLENVTIPFVQRFFVRGKTEDGIPLSGEEIEGQFLANRFNGAVILVGDDYLEFSIRGVTNVSNYFDYRNTVNDIPGACD